MKRAPLLLVALLPIGCNLLLDIGEHHLQSDGGGNAPLTSVGVGGEAGAGGAGEGGSGGEAGSGGAPHLCWPDRSPEVVVSGQVHPTVMRADSLRVYWINEASAVMKAADDIDDGQGMALAENLTNPGGLMLDLTGKSYAYFTENDGKATGLYRVPKSGGTPPTRVAAIEGFDAGALIMTNEGKAYAAAWSKRAGPRIQTLLGTPGTNPCIPYASGSAGRKIGALTAGNEYIYFPDPFGPDVLRVPLDSCAPSPPEPFGDSQDEAEIRALATNGNGYVFWITATQVLRKEKTAPFDEAPEPLAENQPGPRDLKLYGKHAYFTNEEDGTVRRVDPTSHEVCIVAEGQARPYGLAVNTDGKLFWSNYDSGQIVRYVLPAP